MKIVSFQFQSKHFCLLDFFLRIWKLKYKKTIILLVVLYGCETWYFTLWKERRLRAFQNRILRQIFGPKRDDNGEWRRLHT
jgi:hypothetical protein